MKQTKTTPKTTTLTQKLKAHKKLTWAIGIFLSLYVISLFVPLISPFTRYPLFVVRCVGLPLEASEFMGGNSYTVPGNRAYRIDMLSDHYFCSEAEAQAAGFRKHEF